MIDFEDDYYIYIATPNGFNVYNKSQENIKRYFKQRSSSLLSNNINSIIRISETELLIATDKGINMFNTSSKKFSKTLIAEGKNVSHLFKINSDKYFGPGQAGPDQGVIVTQDSVISSETPW